MTHPLFLFPLSILLLLALFMNNQPDSKKTNQDECSTNHCEKKLKIFYMVTISYFFARFKQIIINLFGLYCKNLYLCTRNMMVRHDKWLPHFSFIVSYYFKSYVNINSFKFII